MGRKKVEINPESGKRLKQWLDSVGIQAKTLSKAIGYTPQYISDVITGKKRLTPDLARMIADIPDYYVDSETNQIVEINIPFDKKVSAQWLLCDDDFMTMGERMDFHWDSTTEIQDCIIRIMELKGYETKEENIVTIMADDQEIKRYPPGITLDDVIKFEKNKGRFIDQDKKYTIDDVTKYPQSDCPYFAYHAIFSLKSPKGSIVYLEQKNLDDILDSIVEYIDFKCASRFKKLIDGVKNIYEWG